MLAQKKVVVVGAGPVGALAALYATKRGYQVELYDLRDDPNSEDPTTRPPLALIPFSLSDRGIRAIEVAGVPGLIEDILNSSKAMHTRMVHCADEHGTLKEIPMPYGPNGECLYAVLRERLAKHLLLALQKEPNSTIFFNHKLLSCNLVSKTASFEPVIRKENCSGDGSKPTSRVEGGELAPTDGTKIKLVQFDFVIGCDGAFSIVRQGMMKHLDMDFQQTYVDALWCDLTISSKSDGGYRMNSNSLHLWPDKEGVIVAQPDLDGSFRAGLIAPLDECRELKQRPEKVGAFLRTKHPGIIPNLISAKTATGQLIHHQHVPLMSIKCGKLGCEDSGVLLGDSAHTMVPFHGMGMNTGLEDVRVFFEEFLDPAHRKVLEKGLVDNQFCPPGVIQRYTEYRRPDVHAMTDMAADHYYELRIGVISKASRAKKALESLLQRYLPTLGWKTLYWGVQFSHERFSVVRKKEAHKKRVITVAVLWMFVAGLLSMVSGCLAMVWWTNKVVVPNI